MDFAKKELKKYGWIEGKGLGKAETGMIEALKPKPKRSLGGLGHDMAGEFTNHWWNKVFNNAADNIKINKLDNGEVESIKIDNSNNCKVNVSNNMPLYFQTFVKTAVLKNGTTTHNDDHSLETDKDNNESIIEKSEQKIKHLTDDELFAACGKRTAHKGARHGLKSNGKLARLEMQEKIFSFNAKSECSFNSYKFSPEKASINNKFTPDKISKKNKKLKKHKKDKKKNKLPI